MGKEIDWETREQAEELYIVDGRTFEEAARITGVSVSQLKNWGRDGDWKEKRQEHRQLLRSIKSTKVKLRRELLQKALQSQDPQDVYAAVRLETVAARERSGHDRVAAGPDRPAIFLEDMEFIAATLKEIDPEGLKILARNFEQIVTRFKERNAQAA